jgi:hypothetical protein
LPVARRDLHTERADGAQVGRGLTETLKGIRRVVDQAERQ